MVSFSAVASVLFWVAASTALQLANKALFSVEMFPSVGLLAVAQNLVTVLVCLSQWPSLVLPPRDQTKQLVLLGLYSGMSQLLGLVGSGFVALSMFGVLRRTSIFLALVVGLFHGEQHGFWTKVSVGSMTVGALVASVFDSEFHAVGYAAILLDNLFTVLQRQVLSKSPDLPWASLLLCQTLVALPVSVFFAAAAQPAASAAGLRVLQAAGAGVTAGWFAASAALGPVLQLAVQISVGRVSPLTLSVAGATKNNVLSLAALALATHLPAAANVAGIALSIGGNVLYIYSKL